MTKTIELMRSIEERSLIQVAIEAKENVYDRCLKILKVTDVFNLSIIKPSFTSGKFTYQYQCYLCISGKQMANGPDMHYNIAVHGFRIGKSGKILRELTATEKMDNAHYQAMSAIRDEVIACITKPQEG